MPSSLRADSESQSSAPEAAPAPRPEPARLGWLRGLTIKLSGEKPAGPQIVDLDTNALLAFPSESGPKNEAAVPPAEVHEFVAPASVVPAATERAADGPARSAGPDRSLLAARAAARSVSSTLRLFALATALVLTAAAVALLMFRISPVQSLAALQTRTGNLTIQTRPGGSDVLVDGERRGVTPLTLTLAPGAHTLTVQNGSDKRVVPLTIAAGSDVTQSLDMKTAAPVALFGKLSVATDPPGARVRVDGHSSGVSPIVVADLTAEEHTVVVAGDTGSAERKVMVTAGETAAVMFSLPKASGPVGGWLALSTPFDVEVTESNAIVGALGTTRIMLAAGRHDVVLTNRSVGYQDSRHVEISGGKTTTVRVEAPRVSVSVNARPWADVAVDGSNVGQTPLANLQVAIGTHEFAFLHPQLGERRQTVVVTAKGTNRIAVDLTK